MQGRVGCLPLLAVHLRAAAGNIPVHLSPVIPVIRQGRMDLAQREVGELEVQLLGAPAVGSLTYALTCGMLPPHIHNTPT